MRRYALADLIALPPLLLLLLLLLATPAAAKPVPSAKPYKKDAGPHTVQVHSFEWADAARKRMVPVKIYLPQGKGPFPIVVFSHGLGASRENYEFLGRHWASHGYVSVHPQHLGSDDGRFGGGGGEALGVDNAVARPLDVRFILDRLEAANLEKGMLHGKLDLRRIGMAGHSFGAWTTLSVAGQKVPGVETHLDDARPRAAIALSPALTAGGEMKAGEIYRPIRIPMLHMTGTRDDSPIGPYPKAADRRISFDNIRAGGQYLVTFTGGDHLIYLGFPARPGSKEARFLDLIRESTTAFWDAYLKDDAAAKRWLGEGGLAGVMGADGRLEVK